MKNSKLRRVLLLLACAVMLVSLSVGATLAYLQSQTEVVNNAFSVGRVYITLDEAKVNEYGVPQMAVDYDAEAGEWWYGDTDDITSAARTQHNDYKLYPGKQYPKDPTVHVYKGSETCYVFVKLNKTGLTYTKTTTNEDGSTTSTPVNIEADKDALETGNDKAVPYVCIAEQITANGWVPFGEDADGCPIYVYKNLRNTLDEADDLVVFKNFQIAADAVMPTVTNATVIADLEIEVIAFAIQAEGFSSQNLSRTATDNNIEADMEGAEAAWDASLFGKHSFNQ